MNQQSRRSTMLTSLILIVTIVSKLATAFPWDEDKGHNDPYRVTNYLDPVPGRQTLPIDESINYYEHHNQGDENGEYKRSPCPALNTLANRGFIPRCGINVTYPEIAQSMRDVFNFGDDNIALILVAAFILHGNKPTINLDQFGDKLSWNKINCPAAPTRNDIQYPNHLNLNSTLLANLLSTSQDDETLTFEDMAHHHHARHNESKLTDPDFRFGNLGATCSVVQYANLAATLGRPGPHGLRTLYTSDLSYFYEKEDLPPNYRRRELPYYSVEAEDLVDRITNYIGYQIQRPLDLGAGDEGVDIEPVRAGWEG